MIDISGLTVKYRGKQGDIIALNDINIQIDSGDIAVFIGPSGCGKSTLLHVLAGIIKSYEGSVLIHGEIIDPKLQRIGLVLQNYGLLPWKSVYSNAVLGIKVKNETLKEDKHINDILKRLGLSELLERYPNQLSGGQKQRVALARSFILKPKLLLMDEPFSALDAITRDEMQELFLDVWKENKVTTVFITHSIEEAVYLGKRIIVLSPSPGRITKVIDNPLFGLENLRLRKEYYELSLELRKLIKEEWSFCQ